MTPEQWEAKLIKLESEAFRRLVTIARTLDNSGHTTAKHLADVILRTENNIAQIVGDCPE